MIDNNIAAVYRASAYSPNNVSNDAAILDAVAHQLSGMGYQVTTYSEAELNAGSVHERVIVDMCREWSSIKLLQKLQTEGRIVVNSGFGIENCTRERMTHLLQDHGIPYPESLIVNTDEEVQTLLEEAKFERCWIKRGDFHAMHKEDVSLVRHPEEAQQVLREYNMRGINRAVINRHLEGDLIKFYGVRGSDFFYWFYPFDSGHSKYGHEKENGKSHGYGFDHKYLFDMCQKASEVMDVDVFGGDCIVSNEGDIRIIDFNDWPSFAPCRAAAAPAIAKRIDILIKEK